MAPLPAVEELLLGGHPRTDVDLGRPPATVEEKKGTWGADLRDIVQLAGPAILQLSFQQAVIVTNQSMAGHLGPNELAAAAISTTWFNLMWFFIIGASSALDTLASQAFGAGDRPGVICWAVASTVVLSIMAIPMAVALYVADSVAGVIFQQPPEICELVAIYCRGILPGLWPFIWSLIIMKAMQAQNMMWGPTLVTIGMFIANIFVNLGLIKLYGFTGAAYAQSASRIALFLFLIVYITTFGKGCIQFDRPAWLLEETADREEEAAEEVSTTARIRSAFGAAPDPSDQLQSCAPEQARIQDSAGLTPQGKPLDAGEEPPFAHVTFWGAVKDGCASSRLALFTSLGMAGGIMMAADASSFDITTAMAGFIGVEEVGAHTCLLSIVEFVYTSFPYGIATAATIRVGNMLGAGKPTSARQSAYLCLAGCACFNTAVMIALFIWGDKIGYIFTNDPTVVAIVAKLSFLGALYQIPDCIYGSVSGILRGTGRQASLMWSNLAGFWGIGMPACYLLTFKYGLGVEGLWIGLLTGVSCSSLLVLGMLLLLDWDKEAERAQETALLHQQGEEGDIEEERGGDTFPDSSARSVVRLVPPTATEWIAVGGDHSPLATAHSLPIRRAFSSPMAMHRSGLHPQVSAGSLTGSYARPMNSHL